MWRAEGSHGQDHSCRNQKGGWERHPSVNLAASLAVMGKKTLLVDAIPGQRLERSWGCIMKMPDNL
jgi:hypothetical protein